MKTIKANEGTPYEAKKHFNIWGVRKIGIEEGTKRLNVSQSHFLPNGGAEMSSSDKERAYYVLNGSITVKGISETHSLGPGDMIYIAQGEEREIKVNGNECATTLVIIVEP
jgi:quercetin dioxygenase-like cupin family protein